MTRRAERVSSPADVLRFTESGFPCPGRHSMRLAEVESTFVRARIFEGSPTRPQLWEGLESYLDLWNRLAARIEPVASGSPLIMALWFGGSFISAKFDPHNIDLVVFVDGEMINKAYDAGIRIKSQLGKLEGRAKLEETLGVTPTVVRYHYPGSPWQSNPPLTERQRKYSERRGSLDDWWMRTRPEGMPKGPPSPETRGWRRGYVEVIVDGDLW